MACGLMRAVIACKDWMGVRLKLRFAPRKTYRSYRDKIAKTDALLLEIKISISFIFETAAHKAQLIKCSHFCHRE